MPYGQDAKIGLAFQNSHGTAVTAITSFYLMPFLSESVTPQIPELISQNMQGRFDEGDAYTGARNVAGTISNESQPEVIGMMLKAMFGDPASATNSVAAGTFYTHTFKPRTADFDSNVIATPMTMHKNVADGGTSPVYTDLVATRLELGIRNGEFLTAALALTGGAVGTNQTSAALTAATGKKWTWDVGSIELNGAASVEFDSLSVVIDEQATPRWTVRTQKDPSRVKRDGRRQIRLSGAARFVDQTEYDKFLAFSTQRLKLTLTGTEAIRSGYYNVLGIDIPAFKYLTYPLAFSDPSELIIGFEGKADYHTGSATSIAFTLVNTKATF